MQGTINDVDLKSFLYMVHQGHLDCVVNAVTENGHGTVFFKDGHPVNAEYQGFTGSEALLAILRADKVNLEVQQLERKVDRENEYSLDMLLLETARRCDEESVGQYSDSAFDIAIAEDLANLESNAPFLSSTQTINGNNMLSNQKIQDVLSFVSSEVGEGLVAIDVYSSVDGQSFGGINSNFKACAVFSRITSGIGKALASSEMPAIDSYYLLNLMGNSSAFVIPGDGYEIGMLIDTKKTTVGLVANLVVPKVLEILRS